MNQFLNKSVHEFCECHRMNEPNPRFHVCQKNVTVTNLADSLTAARKLSVVKIGFHEPLPSACYITGRFLPDI